MSSKSPCFRKLWLRHLNLSMAKASQSQRMYEAVSDACLHQSHSGLFTSRNLNKVFLNVNVLLGNLSLFFAGFCSGWTILQLFLKKVFLRQPLTCFCPPMDWQCSSYFLTVQSLITSLATFAYIQCTGTGCMSGCEEPFLAYWSAISFSSIHVSWHPYQSGILQCEAQDWRCVPFFSPISTLQHQCLYWSWTCPYTRSGLLCCLGWTCSAMHTCQGTGRWMACGMLPLVTSCKMDWCCTSCDLS